MYAGGETERYRLSVDSAHFIDRRHLRHIPLDVRPEICKHGYVVASIELDRSLLWDIIGTLCFFHFHDRTTELLLDGW